MLEVCKVVLAMVRSLWCVLQWLWRSSADFPLNLYGHITRYLSRICAFGRLALRWPNTSENADDPEFSNDNNLKDLRSFPEEVENDQREAPAGFLKEPGYEQRRSAENDYDDSESDSEKYRVDTDDFYCGYDSTWETEDHQQSTYVKTRKPAGFPYNKFRMFENAARDMQNYRHNYPVRRQRWNMNRSSSLHDEQPNLKFYRGERPSLPDGIYIQDYHNAWYKDYETLEHVHTFIQWLFPLQEPGMNFEASTLTKEEIKAFLKDSTAKKNLLASYKLMLDFYGITLLDEETGKVKKAFNWEERFDNLNRNTHNSLRITRILKCLGTLGYPHYQYPLVHFFLEETLINNKLPRVKDSVLNYFVFAVLDKRERRGLIRFAYSHYEPKDEFVWCPKKIQRSWSKQNANSL